MKKKTIYLFLPLLALCSCGADSDALPSGGRGEPIVLSGSISGLIEGATRAPIEATHSASLPLSFARLDQNTSTGNWPAWTTVSTALNATRGASSGTAAITFDAGNLQYYPTATSNNSVKLVGWFPRASVGLGGVVNFAIDGKTDIMWTPAITGYATRGDGTDNKFSSSKNVFAFAHQLARITVKAYGDSQASTNWGTITSVKVLNTPVTCTMSLADTPTFSWGTSDGTLLLKNTLNDSDVTGVALSLAGTTQAAPVTCGYAMLAPAEFYKFEVTTSLGGTRTVTITATFAASNHYTVYLNFQSSDIVPNATIGTWTTGSGTPTGDIQD